MALGGGEDTKRKTIEVTLKQQADGLLVKFTKPVVVTAGETLTVVLS